MTIQSKYLDEAAREYGWQSWQDAIADFKKGFYQETKPALLRKAIAKIKQHLSL